MFTIFFHSLHRGGEFRIRKGGRKMFSVDSCQLTWSAEIYLIKLAEKMEEADSSPAKQPEESAYDRGWNNGVSEK